MVEDRRMYAIDEVTFKIIQEMLSRAVWEPGIYGDRRLVFHGSPREIMERQGVSSGPQYKALYAQGLRRLGRGPNSYWLFPSKWADHRKGA